MIICLYWQRLRDNLGVKGLKKGCHNAEIYGFSRYLLSMLVGKKIMPKVLITNQALSQFSGSELVTLDLARELSDQGFEVTIGTFYCSPDLAYLFNKIPVSWIDLNSEKLLNYDYDIIWAHHFSAIDACLFDLNIRAKKIIFSSLSPFEPSEAPPSYAPHLSLLLANSEETRDKIVSYGFSRKSIYVFPNPVSKLFFLQPRRCAQGNIKNIAIISNHVPDELLDASVMFRKNGITTDIYGVQHTYVQITADILSGYDVVITIGRTVQQCIVLGVLVYCYDHFGGPGYINPQNIEKSAYYNFSGRGSNKKKIHEIFDEVIGQYSKAQVDFLKIMNDWSDRYSLKLHVESVLCRLCSLPELNVLQNGFLQLEKLKRSTGRVGNLKQYNYMQVFWREDGGCFSESNSIKDRYYIDCNEKIIKLEFSQVNARISYLRLDFIDCPAYVDIYELCLENHLGSAVWSHDCHDDIFGSMSPDVVLLERDSVSPCLSLLSIGRDPYFVFNINPEILNNITSGYKLVVKFIARPITQGVVYLISKISLLKSAIEKHEASLAVLSATNKNIEYDCLVQAHKFQQEMIRAKAQLELLKEFLISKEE